MNLNATLLGQMITFGFFVWFTLRYVWPLIMKAMDEREKTIANGLAAAEKGVHELEVARHKATEILKEARLQAAEVLEQTNHRASEIIEQAKEQARVEGDRLIELAKSEIAQEREQARFQLQQQVAGIAMAGVEKFLGAQMDNNKQQAVLNQFVEELKIQEAS